MATSNITYKDNNLNGCDPYNNVNGVSRFHWKGGNEEWKKKQGYNYLFALSIL